MSKGKKSKSITILYGLPGSGKSTYAKDTGISVVDADEIGHKFFASTNERFAYLASKVEYVLTSKYTDSVIIDGLFTTNEQLRRIIDSLSFLSEKWQITFKLVYWVEDRAACLVNDQGRRAKSSAISINNLPFEKPDPSVVPEFFVSKNRIKEMQVVQRSPAQIWAKSLDLDSNKMELRSESWSLGGTSGNCWDNELRRISPSSPLEFVEFDELLQKVCPNLSYLQYKEINRSCCRLDEHESTDYYSGSETIVQHVCDINALYNKLSNLGII